MFQAKARNGSRAVRDGRVRRRTLGLIRAVSVTKGGKVPRRAHILSHIPGFECHDVTISNIRTGSLHLAWLTYCAYASDAQRCLRAPDDDVQVGAVLDQCSLGTGITEHRASESDTLRRACNCSCNFFSPSCGSKGTRLHHPAPSTTCATPRTTTAPASGYARQHVRSRVNAQPPCTALCTGSRALPKKQIPLEESWLMTMLQTLARDVTIANQFGHASAVKFAGGRGATTSRVSKHFASSWNSRLRHVRTNLQYFLQFLVLAMCYSCITMVAEHALRDQS